DAWQVVAPSLADDAAGCGSSPDGCIKTIVGNAAMIRAYTDGIPANGKAVPDGAVLAKIEWTKQPNPAAPYAITVPGKLPEVSFMLKDAKRFPDTNGWGYATFRYDAASDTWKAHGKDASFSNTCHRCHTSGAKDRDFVYTSYAPR